MLRTLLNYVLGLKQALFSCFKEGYILELLRLFLNLLGPLNIDTLRLGGLLYRWGLAISILNVLNWLPVASELSSLNRSAIPTDLSLNID